MMKRLCILVTALLGFGAVPAGATEVGVAMAHLDKGFLALLRTALEDTADKMDGVNLKIVIADDKRDVQLDQIRTFLADGVGAIIFQPVDDDVTETVNQMMADAKVPLVYVNRTPPQISFPGNVAIVSSNELVAGRAQMRMLAELAGGKGNVVILRGADSHPAAKGRTRGAKEVLAQNPGLTVVHEETGDWSREKAETIIAGLLSRGTRIDVIAANNDEMAIGAIRAYEKAGVSLDAVVIGGVDGTPAALDEMKAGNLEVSLLQSAPRQAEQAVKDAVVMAKGDFAQLYDWVPYELILPSNLGQYARN
ncbi:monosaccharide ABC transporter substrate-binding protein (CUT2 family) [Breoghania corrubedonensis]|uniref:Monosaccharide ABC transporter substrate-binding protein (CUT2 family) n=1 Tax=Breoghania corrubedonensis TaxID=665038 RepID=A0A2T5VGU7_9HYPH|nr:substrate-binding domain-containing protein [Breoghania corrubedonensis]PTW62974.1 monosaccharide ABC transporter substrate-binding protein (CUT2 family) [Breoghania corrubedonensis]